MSHLLVGNMVLERMVVIWPLPRCVNLAEHLIFQLQILVGEHCVTSECCCEIKVDNVQMPGTCNQALHIQCIHHQ